MVPKQNNYAFIDGQNVHKCFERTGLKVDWKELRIHLKEKYVVKLAYIFLGYRTKNEKLYGYLRESGFNLIFKEVIAGVGYVNGNVDMEIAVQIMRDFKRFDQALIMTNDGDFAVLAKYLLECNKLECLLSPAISICSGLLKKAVGGRLQHIEASTKLHIKNGPHSVDAEDHSFTTLVYLNVSNADRKVKSLRSLVRQDYKLSEVSWLKIGGPADYFAEIKTKEELIEAFKFAREHKLPIVYLGRGSNMIFSDKGLRGLVIKLNHDQVEFVGDSVTVGGAVVFAKLIKNAQKHGFNGLDFWQGIPGTIGAAVAGNVGIPGHEMKDIVKSVEIFDGREFKNFTPEECRFRYRGSKMRDDKLLVWSVNLFLENNNTADSGLPLARIARQPQGLSCGSFFKNPDPSEGLFAGKLMDEAGLKGTKAGGAFISDKHANFLMSDGTATAADILELARLAKKKVLEKSGVMLENEVLLYNEDGGLITL